MSDEPTVNGAWERTPYIPRVSSSVAWWLRTQLLQMVRSVDIWVYIPYAGHGPLTEIGDRPRLAHAIVRFTYDYHYENWRPAYELGSY